MEELGPVVVSEPELDFVRRAEAPALAERVLESQMQCVAPLVGKSLPAALVTRAATVPMRLAR